MKRLLSSSFIALALIISAVGVAPTAHAATCTGASTLGQSCDLGVSGVAGVCKYDSASGSYGCSLVSAATSPGSECTTVGQSCTLPGGTTGFCQQVDTGWSCSVSNTNPNVVPPGTNTPTDGNFGPKNPQFSYNGIMAFIASLFAWLLGVAAITLDNAVYYTVVVMGKYVHNLQAVGIAWRTLRDIGNILLIFGFLAVGISVILNSEWYGGGKKMLPMLLVAAVFLNFSLFISEAVIDVGNLFATQFYQQINGGAPAAPIDFNSKTIHQEGISNKIMDVLGLTTIYGVVADTGGDTTAAQNLFANYAFIGFMSIILFLVAAFVFFTLAFILIFRFIALLFLIIIAPIGFAGLAIPQLKSTASKWWNALFEQTITAPILLLLLYIALLVITDASFLTGFSNCTAGAGGNCNSSYVGLVPGANGSTLNVNGFASVILSFIVAMGLLLAVVIISKKIGAAGAGLASKAGGMLSFGAVSLGGRATLGLAGSALASKRMQAWARTSSVMPGDKYLKRAAVLAGKGLRSSTFDVRNMAGVSTGLSAIGINAGKGTTFNAKQVVEAKGGLKPIQEFLAHSEADRQQAGREIDAKRAQADNVARRAAYDSVPTHTPDEEEAHLNAIAENDRIIAENISKMDVKALEELSGIKDGVQSLIENLSPQQFEALLKSDKLTEAQKEKIKNGRFEGLTKDLAALEAIPDDPAHSAERETALKKVKTRVSSFSRADLEAMPRKMLMDPADTTVLDNLSSQQRDSIMKNEKFSRIDREAIKANRYNPLKTAVEAHNAAGIKAALGSLSKEELETLPPERLSNPEVLSELSPQQYENLVKSDKLTSSEIGSIKTARYTNLNNAIASGNDSTARKALTSLSNGELESMPASMLAAPLVLKNLSDKQRDTITGGKERTAAERSLVRAESPQSKVEATFTTRGAAAAAQEIQAGALTPVQMAKLPKNILLDPTIIGTFVPATLTALQDEKKLQTNEISTITAAIMAGRGPQFLRLQNHINGTVGAAYWG